MDKECSNRQCECVSCDGSCYCDEDCRDCRMLKEGCQYWYAKDNQGISLPNPVTNCN
jgi:hypothetical protein